MDEHKSKWTRLGKVLLYSAALLGVLIIAAVILWNIPGPPVRVTVPIPTMPHPNAYDYYTKAADAQVDNGAVGFAISNADPSHKASPGFPLDKWYSPAEKLTIVKRNALALATFRRGFAYKYLDPPSRSFEYPVFAKYRAFARLLVLEAQTHEERSDWGGAMDCYLDCLRLGVDLPHGGVLIIGLNGEACQSTGRRPVWRIVQRLNGAEARHAAARMEDTVNRRTPYADILREEKWCGQASLMKELNKPGWRKTLFDMLHPYDPFSGSSDRAKPLEDLYLKARIAFMSRRGAVDSYTVNMEQLETNARLPYTKRSGPPITNDPLSEMLLPVFDKARLVFVRSEAQNALLTATLALRAYRLEHARYPSSLSELAPTYLKKIPADPFAMNGPLRYKRTGDKYVLYSLGPDCKDDGGKAVFDRQLAPNDQRYRTVQDDSKGDIVAGVNIN